MSNKLLSAIEDNIFLSEGSVPIVIEGLEHSYDEKDYLPDESMHNSHELLYLREGRIELVLGNESVTLTKGSVVVIRPLVRHKVVIKSGKVDMLNLYFGFVHEYSDLEKTRESLRSNKDTQKQINSAGPSVSIPGSLAKISLESFLEWADRGNTEETEITRQPFFVIKGSEKKEINQLAERIVIEDSKNFYAKEIMVQTLTVELMIIIARAIISEWEESLRVKNGKAKELVAIAKQYMDENFDQGITVSEAAAYVFLSQGYFTRAFRDEMGISPMNYLMKKRIEKACKLLQNNEIKVSAISLQSGFSSPQRFNVAFRKQMGMTPMEYRKKYL